MDFRPPQDSTGRTPRLVAGGSVAALALGAAFGLLLQPSAERWERKPAPTLVGAVDPNYRAYLTMLASLGPAPERRARPAARTSRIETVRWAEMAQPEETATTADTRWVADEASEEVVEPVRQPRYRREEPVYVVERYEPAPRRVYEPEAPPQRWSYSRAPEPAPYEPRVVYGRGYADQPLPPPPPRPSGY